MRLKKLPRFIFGKAAGGGGVGLTWSKSLPAHTLFCTTRTIRTLCMEAFLCARLLPSHPTPLCDPFLLAEHLLTLRQAVPPSGTADAADAMPDMGASAAVPSAAPPAGATGSRALGLPPSGPGQAAALAMQQHQPATGSQTPALDMSRVHYAEVCFFCIFFLCLFEGVLVRCVRVPASAWAFIYREMGCSEE